MDLYPNMHDSAEWSQALAEAISEMGADGFFPSLCAAFTRMPEIIDPLVVYYPEHAHPQALYYTCTTKGEYFRQVESYINGAYVLDPFYQASIKGKSGAFRLSDVAPDNFKKTEYFRIYYRTLNFTDELNYIQTLPEGGHVHLSLGHISKKLRFSIQTVRVLKALGPLVNALVLKHWNLITSAQPGDSALDIQQTLQQALQSFGSSILTRREQAVLQLVLHGHSSNSIAQRLEIALATVKLHRKHIYQKLDIGSQAELFYLFIDSLGCASLAGTDDPLKTYMDISN